MYTCSLFFHHFYFFYFIYLFFSVSLNFLRWLLYYCNEMCHNMFLHFNLAFWIKVFFFFDFLLHFAWVLPFVLALCVDLLWARTTEITNTHTHTCNVMEQRRETIFVSFLFFRLLEPGVLPLALWKKFLWYLSKLMQKRISCTKLEMRNIMCKILSRLPMLCVIFTFIFIKFFFPSLLCAISLIGCNFVIFF